jgi:hypothetical protein
MKKKLAIYQYGSQFDPSGPTRYSPSDWISFSVSEESSPSERSTSIGAQKICTSSSTSDSHADSREDLFTQIYFELQRRMDEIGMTLPDGVDFNYLEYRGLANLVSEACWLRNLLLELHCPLKRATIVYCDNISAIYLSTNPVQHQRTKHVELDIHFVREKVALG